MNNENMDEMLEKLEREYLAKFKESYIDDYTNMNKSTEDQIQELKECLKQGKPCEELFPYEKGVKY